MAWIYLAVAVVCGSIIVKRLVFRNMNEGITETESGVLSSVIVPAGFLVGLLLLNVCTYYGAYLLRSEANPMLIGSFIAMLALVSVAAILLVIRPSDSALNWPLSRVNALDALVFLATAVYAGVIMWTSFSMGDETYDVGYSVFSDFGPHLAVIRSFSEGFNFPTGYPHFPAGNIRYHFMYQFLIGNLEAMGMDLVMAFNLVSTLTYACFMMLLYSLAVRVTGRRSIGFLTLLLTSFRSGTTVFYYLADTVGLTDVMAKLQGIQYYTHNESRWQWGLWTQNVYANQRHLAFGLGIMFICIHLYLNHLPGFKEEWSIQSGRYKGPWYTMSNMAKSIWYYLFDRNLWASRHLRVAIIAGLLLGAISFLNGAVFIATLCILCLMTAFSTGRLDYLLTAIISGVISFMQSAFFIGRDTAAVAPKIQLGFLAESTGLTDLFTYNFALFGASFALFILVFLLFPKDRPLMAAFTVPFLFANTVSLTPDIAVNHKYILITVMLLNIYVAKLLVEIFEDESDKGDRYLATALGSIALLYVWNGGIISKTGWSLDVLMGMAILLMAVAYLIKKGLPVRRMSLIVLVFILTVTGVVDYVNLVRYNDYKVKYPVSGQVSGWVKQNTAPDEVILTNHDVLNEVLLAGRKVYYGWSYYAWSAGYDTGERWGYVRDIYGGTNGDEIEKLVLDEGIDYILIDENVRNSKEYSVNESLLTSMYETVYSGSNDVIILDSRKRK